MNGLAVVGRRFGMGSMRQFIEPGPHVEARHGGLGAAGRFEEYERQEIYGDHDIPDPR
jgi:hypothetical protein